MSFQKGHKKMGGRKKGSQNKLNKDLRARVTRLIDDNWLCVTDDIKKLSPKARVDAILKLLEFTLPRLNKVSLDKGPRVDDLLYMSETDRWNRMHELRKKLGEDD